MKITNREELIKMGKLISDKHFLPKDLEISSRQINYWKERDIIPFFEKEKKGFMNLSEALWLLIINELGQTIKTIQLSSANNLQLKVSDLANGIYFIVCKNKITNINQKTSKTFYIKCSTRKH